MADLFYKVKLYLEANGKTVSEFKFKSGTGTIQLQDDMISRVSNPYIRTWGVSGLAQPTEEQLNSYSAQADTEKANVVVVNTRKKLYGTTAEQFEYLVENGVDAFIAKQNQIKSDNPKT